MTPPQLSFFDDEDTPTSPAASTFKKASAPEVATFEAPPEDIWDAPPADYELAWEEHISLADAPPVEDSFDVPSEEELHPHDAPVYETAPNTTSSTGIPASLTDGLNPQQEEAVRTLTGPVMVVAGPGSGKTSVLTRRIAALVATGTPAWQILAVTFTNKAAAEMRERVGSLIGSQMNDMWVSTFHSACVRILRANAEAAGLPRSFSILDSSDAQRVVRQVMQDMGEEKPEASVVKEVASAISSAKNAAKTPADLYASARPSDRVYAEYMQRYNDRLTQMGGCDFDDLLLKTLYLLSSNEQVRLRYQRRFRHVLIDEYQDTNPVQYQIVQLLGLSADSMFIVGDRDQAVYSFRGASPEGMNSFETDYPKSKIIVLEQNYRSTKAILEVARAVIDPNPALHRPKLFTENPDGLPVRYLTAPTDRDEADWVVGEIRRTKEPLKNHAVIFRTNSQSRTFEEALTKNALAYQVVGALRFYDRQEVKDILAYLKMAANPFDSVSFERTVNLPRRGLGDATVHKVIALSRTTGVSLLEAAETAATDPKMLTKRAREGFMAYLSVMETLQEKIVEGPVEAIRFVIGSGLREHYEKDKQSGRERIENMEELVSSAESFLTPENNILPSGDDISKLTPREQVDAYLENVALVSSADDESPAGSVLLMTAHASKGKEFPHVFVVGIEDNFFPHSRSKTEEGGLEEERRLLFVAVSRAKVSLSLSRAKERFSFAKMIQNPASPFLKELPDSVEIVPPRSGRFSQNAYSPSRAAGSQDARRFTPDVSRNSAPAASVPTGPRLKAEDVFPGLKVHHPIFGEGIVLDSQGTRVTIKFGVQRKVLDLAFAPLTKS